MPASKESSLRYVHITRSCSEPRPDPLSYNICRCRKCSRPWGGWWARWWGWWRTSGLSGRREESLWAETKIVFLRGVTYKMFISRQWKTNSNKMNPTIFYMWQPLWLRVITYRIQTTRKIIMWLLENDAHSLTWLFLMAVFVIPIHPKLPRIQFCIFWNVKKYQYNWHV